MGGRAGGGASGGMGQRSRGGRAFESTYGTSGSFGIPYGKTMGKPTPLGQVQYPVAVYGNKKLGVETFKDAASANAFMDKLSKNGFKTFNSKGKTTYTQTYMQLQNYKMVQTTQKPSKINF